MNREIKFRAWYYDEDWPEFSHMMFVCSIDFVQQKAKIGILENIHKFNQIKLMQYTGKKDKNGVEIYEGDIVRYAEFNCPVLWSKDLMWCIDINNGYGEEMLTAYFDYELEVIGNIYENPELLEGKDGN